MARFCFLPPTKRPAKDSRIKTRRNIKPIKTNGIQRRLEPIFIPKNRLYKRGVLNHTTSNESQEIGAQKHNQETPSPKTNPEEVMSQKLLAKHEKQGKQKRTVERKEVVHRELFPDVPKRAQSILEIVDENFEQQIKDDEIIKKIKESTSKDGFKKPTFKPTLSKKAKKKRINQSVIDSIRKTQKSIQNIRNKALFGTDSYQEMELNLKGKKKPYLNVQVSLCVPNKGIQKSQCTVQQSGSIEEETIGYQYEKIKSYQDFEDLL